MHRRNGAKLRLVLNKSAARSASLMTRLMLHRDLMVTFSADFLHRLISSSVFTRLHATKAGICARELRSCSWRGRNEDNNSETTIRLTAGWICLQAVGRGGFSTRVSAPPVDARLSGRWRFFRTSQVTCTRARRVPHSGFSPLLSGFLTVFISR